MNDHKTRNEFPAPGIGESSFKPDPIPGIAGAVFDPAYLSSVRYVILKNAPDFPASALEQIERTVRQLSIDAHRYRPPSRDPRVIVSVWDYGDRYIIEAPATIEAPAAIDISPGEAAVPQLVNIATTVFGVLVRQLFAKREAARFDPGSGSYNPPDTTDGI